MTFPALQRLSRLASLDAIGRVLAPRGLLLIGLDVIGDSVTEINVTSPTGCQEITQQAGFNVAALFIDTLEADCGFSAR